MTTIAKPHGKSLGDVDKNFKEGGGMNQSLSQFRGLGKTKGAQGLMALKDF